MSQEQLRHRAIALAGVFQSASLVQDVARRGEPEAKSFQSSIGSIFKVDAPSAQDVFGGLEGVALGLNVLCRQLEKPQNERDLELTRYAVSLLTLDGKLVRRRDLLGKISDGIRRATEQAQFFSTTHENVISSLAELYSNTVSTLPPRIMVSGEPHFLQNPTNAAKIRALLLAGIRASVLWRQSGGTRLRLLFTRRRLVEDAQAILADIGA